MVVLVALPVTQVTPALRVTQVLVVAVAVAALAVLGYWVVRDKVLVLRDQFPVAGQTVTVAVEVSNQVIPEVLVLLVIPAQVVQVLMLVVQVLPVMRVPMETPVILERQETAQRQVTQVLRVA